MNDTVIVEKIGFAKNKSTILQGLVSNNQLI